MKNIGNILLIQQWPTASLALIPVIFPQQSITVTLVLISY